MARTLKDRIHFVLGLTGAIIICLGIFIFAAGFMAHEELPDTIKKIYKSKGSQFWAGIPVILTGSLLIVVVRMKERQRPKILSALSLVAIMILTLGVIVEEATIASTVQSAYNTFDCEQHLIENPYCKNLDSSAAWYYVLLFASDITLFLSLVALLALFANWILFTAMKEADEFESTTAAYQPVPQYDYRCTGNMPARQLVPPGGMNQQYQQGSQVPAGTSQQWHGVPPDAPMVAI